MRAILLVLTAACCMYAFAEDVVRYAHGDAFVYENTGSRHLSAIRGYPMQQLLRVIAEAEHQ